MELPPGSDCKLLVMGGHREGGEEVIILSVPDTAVSAFKREGGCTVLDLSKLGFGLKLMLVFGESHDEIVAGIQEGVTAGGGTFERQGGRPLTDLGWTPAGDGSDGPKTGV